MTYPSQSDRILVDTDVFSFIFRGHPRAASFRPYLVNRTAALSFMSVAELHYGALKDQWSPARMQRLEAALGRYVVLPFDQAVCLSWARVRHEREAKGKPIGVADAWIAASALVHDCALATNDRDFSDIAGLTVIKPPLP
jgi:predicted nucleic acid-binding protein